MPELIGYLLTGAAAAAFIKLVDNVIQWALARKAKREDTAEERSIEVCQGNQMRIDKLEKSVTAVSCAQRYILLDRIRYLGLNFLKDKEISFEDRQLLHKMHSVYHNDLGGNGDLDILMREIDELPLKQ